ncbi:PEP/pyruvate-binding domain-containing protein [Gordonia rhizosphera]|uniref:Phosphoenolpyruvate synthase n=1 Tax=Gordonia rhizosphera NBRC 16068 TaxID=1108045 RepID=K6VXB2_9ACTN|nr:PEP/pyruvate-binding domain-containing protein [Gordonia rhizosphera]GAB91560.1 hypothetical protein GORHZ_136_00230 [Gordonia rhizosphera NBRC 16068]
MTTNPYVTFFDSGETPTLESLGGKCASLVTLTAAGMPVPPGFAVTTAAYSEFADQSGLKAKIETSLAHLDADDVVAVDSVSASIRDHIRSCAVPTAIRESVVNAYQSLQSRFTAPAPVAVRSSATAEDLPGASFAGQQDTYLWLSGLQAVLDHIRECWASLYTSRAIIYRLKNDIPDDGLAMAVAVQKMVNSQTSGVAMTMNPTTGDRSKITIDASYGVGEMVVSGQVTPDNIVVDKVMLSLVSETIGAKHHELVPDATTGRLVAREVAAERRCRRSISDEEVVAIATMAKRAEKHYGCPQDIEWAIDRDLPEGQGLLLLQARPETVHSTKPPVAAPATPVTVGASTSPTGFLSGITSSLTMNRKNA